MTPFQNLILFTNHYGNLQEMFEMASFLKYVGFYLTSEWGRFYVGHPIELKRILEKLGTTVWRCGLYSTDR
jgi:sugar phosphate isomerase/epimerase